MVLSWRLTGRWKMSWPSFFGYSGAGKSLTLQLIAGLLKPDAGRIAANGEVLFDSQKRINLPPQRRSLGMFFRIWPCFRI